MTDMRGDSVSKLFFSHFSISSGDPDRDMLRAVITHFAEIPYENITKIITKFTVDDPEERLRTPEEVLGSFIENHTGGTCFSLTWCLGSVLSGAGFRCYPVMADMKRENVHCALVVHVGEKRYIVDPGYLLGEPVLLAASPVSVETSFGKVELRPRGTVSYDLFAISGVEKKWRYRVRTTPVAASLFARYWKESFSLPMMNSLQLTRLTGEGHLYIKNHHLRLRKGDRRLNENIRAELHTRIESEFGIPPEITARAHEYIERMKEGWRIRKQESQRRGLR